MRRDEKLIERYDPGRGSQFLDFISKEIKGKQSKNSNVDRLIFRVGTFRVTNHRIEELMISFHRLSSPSQEEEQVWFETVRRQSMLRVWVNSERTSSRIVMLIMITKKQAIGRRQQKKNKA